MGKPPSNEQRGLLQTPSSEKDVKDSSASLKYWLISLGIVYTIIVCGLATVAIGALIEDLAANVGKLSTEIGTVYVARGVGGISGSIVSFPLFELYNAVRSLIILHMVTLMVMLWLPFITEEISLHIAYFLVGFVTAVIQAGAMVLLRKYHKEAAGPWLGAFGAAFCSAGLIVPAVQLCIPSLHGQFYAFSFIVFLGLLWLVLLPHIKEDIHWHHYHVHEIVPVDQQPGHASVEVELANSSVYSSPQSNYFSIDGHDAEWVADEEAEQPPEGKHYKVELVIATMIFFLIGGGDTVTFYLETYVDETLVDTKPHSKAGLLLVFFLFSLLGDCLGIVGQIGVSDRGMSLQLLAMFVLGSSSMILVLMNPGDTNMLWFGVAGLGLSNAPSISYSFGLNNRLTSPTASSTAIIILGLNLGVSLIPYMTSLLWNWYDEPGYLPLSAALCTLVAIPLLFLAPKLSYIQRVKTPPFLSF